MQKVKGKSQKSKAMVIAVLFLFVFAGVAVAHPPSAIIIKYDAKEKVLTLDIMHDTKDPKSHFIEEAWVTINGMLMTDQKALSQGDGVHQLFKYVVIDLKPGDKVDASAECVIFGKGKSSIVIQTPAPEGAKKVKK